MSTPALVNIRLRPGRPEDAPELGRINYEAFSSIAGRHGYPPDVSSVEAATVSLRGLLNHPKFYSVVAESSGRILGSNFLDERSIVTGVGPITVDPLYQNSSVGKELMLDVMRRSNEIELRASASSRQPGTRGPLLCTPSWGSRSGSSSRTSTEPHPRRGLKVAKSGRRPKETFRHAICSVSPPMVSTEAARSQIRLRTNAPWSWSTRDESLGIPHT